MVRCIYAVVSPLQVISSLFLDCILEETLSGLNRGNNRTHSLEQKLLARRREPAAEMKFPVKRKRRG